MLLGLGFGGGFRLGFFFLLVQGVLFSVTCIWETHIPEVFSHLREKLL